MTLILAMLAHAVELSIDRSQSFACLRRRPSQTKVRSTTKQRGAQFIFCIFPIGQDVTQPRQASANGFQDIGRAVTILTIGSMNQDKKHQAELASSILNGSEEMPENEQNRMVDARRHRVLR